MAAAGAATEAVVVGAVAVAAVVVIEVIAAETAVTEAIAGKRTSLKILGDFCAVTPQAVLPAVVQISASCTTSGP
jgi:hypothetical protein